MDERERQHPPMLLHGSEVSHPTTDGSELATCAICLRPITDIAEDGDDCDSDGWHHIGGAECMTDPTGAWEDYAAEVESGIALVLGNVTPVADVDDEVAA